MTEIVDRLRAHHGSAYMCQDCYGTTMDDAADEIERLTAENERLMAALRKIARGTEGEQYPFRVVPAEYLRQWAADALNQQTTVKES